MEYRRPYRYSERFINYNQLTKMKGKRTIRRAATPIVLTAVVSIAMATTIEKTNSAIAEWCKTMDVREGRV